MKKIVIGLALGCVFLLSCNREKKNQLSATIQYMCPMHPSVMSDKPGICPVCGMNLVETKKPIYDESVLKLSDSQIKLANITTQQVLSQPIGQTLAVNARLAVNEDHTEIISSRAAGRIEKLFVKETGRNVKQGEPLYELYSESLLTMQREFLLAKEQYEEFGKDQPHYGSFLKAAEKKLLLYGLSKKQITQLAESKTMQQRTTFLAPVSGIVNAINATEGQYISEGAEIYRIENLNNLWLEAELYPTELTLVKIGDQLKVVVTGLESSPAEATVTFISPEYKANTQITLIRAWVSNSGYKFKPGMQAQVFFTHSSKKVLTVPSDAVIRDGKSPHVYVQVDKHSFQPRKVKTGQEDFDQVEITEGLREGEPVAVTGAYLLYSELMLKKGTILMTDHHSGEAKAQVLALTENEKKPEAVDRNPKFNSQLKAILLPYLKIKNALVTSDASSASAGAKELNASLSIVDMSMLNGEAHTKWMAYLKDMETAVKRINATGDIEIQRVAFSALTNAFYDIIKTFRVEGIHAYYQFCPMAFNNKGGYWISTEKEINNPYFGQQMLRCGETKETLE